MTVTLDGKYGYTGNGAGSVQWSHTVGNHSNLILIVGYSAYDNTCNRPTAIRWTATGHGAQALTKIREDAVGEGGVGGHYATMWYLLNPTVGAGTIAVTNGNTYAEAVSYSYYNVNQTTPFDGATGALATGSGNSPSVSITLNYLNEMVFNFCGWSTYNNAGNQFGSFSSGQIDGLNEYGYIAGVENLGNCEGCDEFYTTSGSKTLAMAVTSTGDYVMYALALLGTSTDYTHTFAQYMGGLPAKTSFKSVIKTIAQYMAGKGTLTGHAHAVNITGYTRDSNGTPLGSVTVYLYRTSDDALIGSTTSNASTGAYAFNNVPYTNYYLVAMLKGSPDKFGCTDNNIT